jgi:hypothetical protein
VSGSPVLDVSMRIKEETSSTTSSSGVAVTIVFLPSTPKPDTPAQWQMGVG